MAGEKIYELGNLPKEMLRRYQQNGLVEIRKGGCKRKSQTKNKMLRAMEEVKPWQKL